MDRAVRDLLVVFALIIISIPIGIITAIAIFIKLGLI